MQTQKGSTAKIISIIVALILAGFGIYSFTHKTVVEAPAVDTIRTETKSLADSAFTDFLNDPESRVLARGDINNDGFEDAIVQEIHCGASCGVTLAVVLNENNTTVKLMDINSYNNFEPGFRSSGAATSDVKNITITKGVITFTGSGLDCGDSCTAEKWDEVKTIKYKYQNGTIVRM